MKSMTIQQIEPALLYDSNIYLVSGSKGVALIDTGTGFQSGLLMDRITDALAGRELDVIILTHRHFDHVGGVSSIISKFNPKIYAGGADASPLRAGDSESTLGTVFGGHIEPMDIIDFNDGDVIDLGDHKLRCIETPGHTIGSICILDETTGSLFSGDTFMVGSVGNYSHPTGSADMLVDSLRKLLNIEFDGLYPGHGPSVKSNGKQFLLGALNIMGAE